MNHNVLGEVLLNHRINLVCKIIKSVKVPSPLTRFLVVPTVVTTRCSTVDPDVVVLPEKWVLILLSLPTPDRPYRQLTPVTDPGTRVTTDSRNQEGYTIVSGKGERYWWGRGVSVREGGIGEREGCSIGLKNTPPVERFRVFVFDDLEKFRIRTRTGCTEDDRWRPIWLCRSGQSSTSSSTCLHTYGPLHPWPRCTPHR